MKNKNLRFILETILHNPGIKASVIRRLLIDRNKIPYILGNMSHGPGHYTWYFAKAPSYMGNVKMGLDYGYWELDSERRATLTLKGLGKIADLNNREAGQQ